jgi:two-component system LytT family response regulator
MKALIVDDERRARDRLVRMLAAFPDVEVAGEAGDGITALEAIGAARPDVVFLDVQMPGLSGFDVLAELPAAGRPLVVFVTAYDNYALQAFEVSAVDYLLKPVEEERLARAVAKLRDQAARDGIDRLLATLQKSQTLQRIVGKRLQKLHVLAVDAIDAFVAEDELVFAVTASGRFLVDRTLRDLEARLDPERFARVHKRAIVNLAKIKEIEPIVKAGASARLESGQTIEISRRYAHELRQKLGW